MEKGLTKKLNVFKEWLANLHVKGHALGYENLCSTIIAIAQQKSGISGKDSCSETHR